MAARTVIILTTAAALVGAVPLLAPATDQLPAKPQVVQIGVVSSLFRDFPRSAIPALLKPFQGLMESQAGIRGDVILSADGETLGKMLADNQVQFGVFIGYEFAWARQPQPNLKPLVIGVNRRPQLRACLVVKSDSAVAGFGDLKGKTLAMPYQSRPHSRLFAERRCQSACGSPMESWVGEIANPANEEDALDDVVDGAVAAAVVDALALESFQERKPGRFNRLKVAIQSELFPAGVIAYLPGSIDEAAVGRFKEGLLHAHENKKGQQLLMMTGLTHFERVPDNYEQLLLDIAKAYAPVKE